MDSPLLQGLNAAQIEAVSHHQGPLLMLAGPGSGKTRVITHRIAHMIEQGIAPGNILALTFTNKSAMEMRRRLERLVGPHEVWLGTFHSMCVRLLRRYGRLVGLPENFSIYDVEDAYSVLKAAVEVADCELTHVTLGTIANRISFFKNRLITAEMLEAESLSSEEYQVTQVYPIYQQMLLKQGGVDFDDLLLHTAMLLRTHPELRTSLDEHFRYVMVDEYQDTNLAQYVIVRHLCVDHPNLAVTGDPDQSIYSWRGANIKNIVHLERDYPDLHIVRLQENYRSTPEILAIADALIQNNVHRREKRLVPSRDAGSRVRLAVYPTASSEAEDIAHQIQAMVQETGANYNDFGILYRTNANSRQIEQALVRHGIPHQLIGGCRFFTRKEIKDVLSYLLLIYNPGDDIAFQRAINTPPRGIGKKSLDRLREFASRQGLPLLEACRHAGPETLPTLSKRASTSILEFLKLFDSLASLAHGPLLDLLTATLEVTAYREYLEQQSKVDECEAGSNLDELLANARELDEDSHDDRPALERFLESSALEADTDRLELEAPAVTLMTLHAAKGLEFPFVYLIAVEENVLPHVRSKDDPRTLEEERRLLFVGITRAENRLQLSYAKRRGFANQGSGVASSFLMELPRGDMDVADNTDLSEVHFDGESSTGFDDAFDPPAVDWDELAQVSPEMSDSPHADVDDDDFCQLPPDEQQQRSSKISRLQRGRFGIRGGTDLERAQTNQGWSQFHVGSLVIHQRFGDGEIISTSGEGYKRAITIRFVSDQSCRSFRLSHVASKLTPVSSC